MKVQYYISIGIFVALTTIIVISIKKDRSYNKQININEVTQTIKDSVMFDVDNQLHIISIQIDSMAQSFHTCDSVTINHLQSLEKNIDLTLKRLQQIEYKIKKLK